MYRRALDEEEQQKLIDEKVDEQIKSGAWNLNNKQKTNQTDRKTSSGAINVKTILKQCPFIRGSTASNDKKATEVVDDNFLNSKILNSTSNEDVVNENNTIKKPTESNADVEIPQNRQPIVLPGGIVMPSPRVETLNTSWKTQHLTHEQVNDYCKKLFRFTVTKIMHFK